MSKYDASLLSFYSGIMAVLDGFVRVEVKTTDELNEYVQTLAMLAEDGVNDVLYGEVTKN